MIIIPNDIRKLALSITRRCVSALGGIGGFATLGFRGLVAYSENPFSDLIGPYRKDFRPFGRICLGNYSDELVQQHRPRLSRSL